MWIIPLVTILLAAAESERTKPRRPLEGPPLEPPGPPPRLPAGSTALGMAVVPMSDAERLERERQAIELLGEGWPKEMSEFDDLFSDGMTLMDYPPHPWTGEQLAAFRAGRLICPLGHEGPFHYLRLNVRAEPLAQKSKGLYVTDETEDHEWWQWTSALIYCSHDGHDVEGVEGSTTQVFWYPFDYGMGVE